MGFIDFLKKLFAFLRKRKKTNKASPAREEVEKATALLGEGKAEEALRVLSLGFQKDPDHLPLYGLAVKALQFLEVENEARLFQAAIERFDESYPFAALGGHFNSLGQYGMAIPFLERAHRVSQEDVEIAYELAIALARRFQVHRAFTVLGKAQITNDFWSFWYYCKIAILANKPDGIAKNLEDLTRYLQDLSEIDDVSLAQSKVTELQEMLIRLQRLPNPRTHIRDWQFIQYGGVVLDLFEEGGDYVAGGRYVTSWGNPDWVKRINLHLKVFLELAQARINKVCALPDRDSVILGRALALELGWPFEEFGPDAQGEQALIVAADSHSFDEFPSLRAVQKGQVLFALNHNWLQPCAITPDIIGMMNQSFSHHWNGGGFTVTPGDEMDIKRNEPDTREPEAIAREIFERTVKPAETFDFYAPLIPWVKGLGEYGGDERFSFMVESPVPGSHFGI